MVERPERDGSEWAPWAGTPAERVLAAIIGTRRQQLSTMDGMTVLGSRSAQGEWSAWLIYYPNGGTPFLEPQDGDHLVAFAMYDLMFSLQGAEDGDIAMAYRFLTATNGVQITAYGEEAATSLLALSDENFLRVAEEVRPG